MNCWKCDGNGEVDWIQMNAEGQEVGYGVCPYCNGSGFLEIFHNEEEMGA